MSSAGLPEYLSCKTYQNRTYSVSIACVNLFVYGFSGLQETGWFRPYFCICLMAELCWRGASGGHRFSICSEIERNATYFANCFPSFDSDWRDLAAAHVVLFTRRRHICSALLPGLSAGKKLTALGPHAAYEHTLHLHPAQSNPHKMHTFFWSISKSCLLTRRRARWILLVAGMRELSERGVGKKRSQLLGATGTRKHL